MDKPVEFEPGFLLKLFNGEYPETIRHTYGWFGTTKTEFGASANSATTYAPIWLKAMSEEKMQESTVLEVINAPKHLKGHWKQVFDENKNVVVKYFPTPEEEEAEERYKRYSKNNDVDWFL